MMFKPLNFFSEVLAQLGGFGLTLLLLVASCNTADAQQLIFPGPGTAVRVSDVLNVKTVFGCVGNGIVDDTTCIQNALNAIPQYTVTAEFGTNGGTCVYLPPGAYKITATLQLATKQNTGAQYCIFGSLIAGSRASYLVWAGGNNAPMILVSHTGNNPGIQDIYIGHLYFLNSAQSGTGLTALRAQGIDGIQFNNNATSGAGQERGMVEDNEFVYVRNGISTFGPMDRLVIRHNNFLAYNATNPVVDPNTDALVRGAGNALAINSNATTLGVITSVRMYDNDIAVQNSAIEAQVQVVGDVGITSLSFYDNFVYNLAFTRSRGLQLEAFTRVNIQNNFFNNTGGQGVSTAGWLNLGSTQIGSSSVSGAIITGNYFTGSVAGPPQITLGFADSTVIGGNSFFNVNTGISLSANSTNTTILTNNWGTVTTRLVDNSAAGTTTILDQTINSGVQKFPAAISVGTTPSNAGLNGTINIPYNTGLFARNSTNTNNIDLIFLQTSDGVANTVVIGDTGQADIKFNGGTRIGAPTGGNLGAGTMNVLTAYGLNGVKNMIAGAPTISSGFGTSPSVTGGNTAAFRVNVGTGGVATSGVIAMNATATNGWNCFVEDQTTANINTRQSASTTTTVTFSTSVAWTASDILIATCTAF